MTRVALLCLLPLALACASTKEVSSPFTSKAALDEIAASEAKLPKSPKVLEARTWTFSTTAAETWVDTPLASPAPWMKAAAATGATLSTALSCYATELASFYRTHRVYPGRRVSEFMAARCGTPILSSGSRVFTLEIDDAVPLAEILERQQSELDKMVRSAKAGDVLGLGTSRADGVLVFALVVGRASVEILAGTPTPNEAGDIVLRARTRAQGTLVAGVSHGPFALKSCTFDPAVELPDFVMTCPVDATDPSAWISVVAHEKGRILGRRVLNVLARPAQGPVEVYERFDYTSGAELEPDDVLGLLNHVRAQAGVPAVALDTAQSKSVRDLAPHLIGALIGNEAKLSDDIALGIIAGWDVDGLVQSGGFTSELAVSSQKLSPADLLTLSLERPLGRHILLDAGVDRVALGPFALKEAGTNGLVISTYKLFEPTDHQAAADAVYERLGEMRPAGRAGLGRHLGIDVVELGRDLESGKLDPDAGLQRMMKAVVKESNKGAKGWLLRTTDLRLLSFPEDLLKDGVDVAIAVGHERAEGAAWGNYVVIIGYSKSDARLARSSRTAD